MKYSIIIPIYNAAPTLPRCLSRIAEQAVPDAEVLLVNDGSTDRSEEICHEYIRKNPNWFYFSQEKAGVSAARNLGLEHANGRYILFVDSDDYIASDYFTSLEQELQHSADDLVFFSYRILGEGSYVIQLPDRTTHSAAESCMLAAKLMRKQQFNTLWSKVFVRSVIERHGLRFDTMLDIDEDVTFIFSYLLHVQHMRLSSKILYNNCVDNRESLTRKRRDYLCQQLLYASRRRMALLDQAALSNDCRAQLLKVLSWSHYRSAYSSAAELMKYDLTPKARRRRIREICDLYTDTAHASPRLDHLLISVPLRLRMTPVIDLAAQCAVRMRKL